MKCKSDDPIKDKKISETVGNYDIKNVKYDLHVMDTNNFSIIPIEHGNSTDLRNIVEFKMDCGFSVLTIPIKNIHQISSYEKSIRVGLRTVVDKIIKIDFIHPTDPPEAVQYIEFNPPDKYIETIIENIKSLQSLNTEKYMESKDIVYNIGDSKITNKIFPRTPLLGKDESILWIRKQLNDITNENIVILQALTNFRIFEYDFEKHECIYLLLDRIQDVLVGNKKWVLNDKNESNNVQLVSGDLYFVNDFNKFIIFKDVADPIFLKRMLQDAKEDLLKKQGETNVHIKKIDTTSNLIKCDQCGNKNLKESQFCYECGYPLRFIYAECGHLNPEFANFCSKCQKPIQKISLSDPINKANNTN